MNNPPNLPPKQPGERRYRVIEIHHSYLAPASPFAAHIFSPLLRYPSVVSYIYKALIVAVRAAAVPGPRLHRGHL